MQHGGAVQVAGGAGLEGVVSCGRTVAFLLGSEGPLLAVICDAKGDPPGVRMFSLVFADAPPPEDVEADNVEPVCARCLLEEHPEAGRGMDLAAAHGCAVRDPVSGAWRVSESGDFFYEDALEMRSEAA